MFRKLFMMVFGGLFKGTEKALMKGNPVQAVEYEILEMEKELRELHAKATVVGKQKFNIENSIEESKNKLAILETEIKLALSKGKESVANAIARDIEVVEARILELESIHAEAVANTKEGIETYNRLKEQVEIARNGKEILIQKLEIAKIRESMEIKKVDISKYTNKTTSVNELISDLDSKTKAMKELRASERVSEIEEFRAEIKNEVVSEKVSSILDRYRTPAPATNTTPEQ